MIGISSSSRSFGALAAYLVPERAGRDHDRVDWIAARNLPTDEPELVAKIMRATAAENARVRQPVYHLALSFDPDDAVDRAMMERVADRVLARLGLDGHQALIVAHRDRDHPHLHLLVNRVHPETGKVWDRWQDRRVVQEILREEERALGLRQVPGTLVRTAVHESAPRATAVEPAPDDASAGRATGDAAAAVAPPDRALIGARTRSDAQTVDRAPAGRADVARLAREQFAAARAAEAARARADQLDVAVERVHATRHAFVQSLDYVYADPRRALDAFHDLADRRGAAEAIRTLRDDPERLGPLVTVERRGLLARVRAAPDDGPSRTNAPAAAAAGREYVEAVTSFRTEAAEARVRRTDDALARAFADLYADPTAARAALLRLTTERATEYVASQLSAQPESFGALQVTLAADPTRRAEVGARAAGAARDAIEARSATLTTTDVGATIRAERWAEAEPALTRQAAELAVARARVVGDAPRALDPPATRTRQAARAVVGPAATSGGGVLADAAGALNRVVAAEIRRAARDAALGRDEERER